MSGLRHIAIAGGGIIGLACALALRHRGFPVTVLEVGETAKEASWAAGGMLASEDPENPAALLAFSRYSRSLYDEFLSEIETLSGKSVPLRTHETIQVLEHGRTISPGTPLSRSEAQTLIPGLAGSAERYILLEEASLDPRELCAALRSAVIAAGAILHEQERVLSAEAAGEDVLVATSRSTMRVGAFLNCCGAWAASLNSSISVAPSKGQMLVIAQPKHMLLTRVLRSPEVYLIPRGDGRIVIGATVENSGYSKQVESQALDALRMRAAALWPPAADAPRIDSWAGLRPGTPDALPVIGGYEEGDTLRFVATGHFRNGILLAPGTARVMADLINGREPAVDLASFSPRRASTPTVCDKHFAAAL